MTQGVWVCTNVCGDPVTERSTVSRSYGSWVTLPTTQRLPSQPAVPSPPLIALFTHPEKSSSSRPTTVKPLLWRVAARERAALSSILPGHMLGVFRKTNCIISWPWSACHTENMTTYWTVDCLPPTDWHIMLLGELTPICCCMILTLRCTCHFGEEIMTKGLKKQNTKHNSFFFFFFSLKNTRNVQANNLTAPICRHRSNCHIQPHFPRI